MKTTKTKTRIPITRRNDPKGTRRNGRKEATETKEHVITINDDEPPIQHPTKDSGKLKGSRIKKDENSREASSKQHSLVALSKLKDIQTNEDGNSGEGSSTQHSLLYLGGNSKDIEIKEDGNRRQLASTTQNPLLNLAMQEAKPEIHKDDIWKDDLTIRKSQPEYLELGRINFNFYHKRENLPISAKCRICKVHSCLRNINTKEYEPILISIGPYHHGNPQVIEMEKYKYHYFKELFTKMSKERKNELRTELGLSTAVLDCYMDNFAMNRQEFETCMVVDAFFLVELMRRFGNEATKDDPIFKMKWMRELIKRDLLLFENQIPFFMLRKLLQFTNPSDENHDDTFVDQVFQFFDYKSSISTVLQRLPLEFGTSDAHWEALYGVPHLLGLVYVALVRKTPQQIEKDIEYKFIRSATALEEVGVKFHKASSSYDSFYIDFKDGVLSIPELKIDDYTESFFRNLAAYEQYSDNYELHVVTDYLQFMDCLINSSKDVELLRHCQIIENRLGDDKKVSDMFNRLCTSVHFDQKKFYYAETFCELDEFCRKKWNVEMAKLWHQYFDSTWSRISFVAAVLLLGLTASQTVYTLLSYYNSN